MGIISALSSRTVGLRTNPALRISLAIQPEEKQNRPCVIPVLSSPAGEPIGNGLMAAFLNRQRKKASCKHSISVRAGAYCNAIHGLVPHSEMLSGRHAKD